MASNDTTSFATTFDIASNDICPKGWRLPIGAATSSAQSSTREFGQLWFNSGITTGVDTETYATNGFNKIRTAPLFFVRAGYVYGGDSLFKEAVFSGFGGGGDYWSSALSGRGSGGFSSFSKTQVINDSATMNTNGYSLRCVVR